MRGIARVGTCLTLGGIAVTLATAPMRADMVRLSEDDAKKSLISKVAPSYPPIARQLNLSGRVVVDLLVGEDGNVEKADIVSGNPVLGGAATAAGKRWKFQPFQAKTIVRINFDFSK